MAGLPTGAPEATAIDRILEDPAWGAELAAAALPRLDEYRIKPLSDRVARLHDELPERRRRHERGARTR